jgi:hypothetical protein
MTLICSNLCSKLFIRLALHVNTLSSLTKHVEMIRFFILLSFSIYVKHMCTSTWFDVTDCVFIL